MYLIIKYIIIQKNRTLLCKQVDSHVFLNTKDHSTLTSMPERHAPAPCSSNLPRPHALQPLQTTTRSGIWFLFFRHFHNFDATGENFPVQKTVTHKPAGHICGFVLAIGPVFIIVQHNSACFGIKIPEIA